MPPLGCEDEGAFKLQNHCAANISQEKSLELIADFFSQISQEYDALNINLLPERVKVKLNSTNPDQIQAPQLSEPEVREAIRKSKKTNSMVPGDLPKSIVKEYSGELAVPFAFVLV